MPSVRVKLIITDEIAELRNKEESQDFQEETAPTQSITRPKRLRNPPKRLAIDASKKYYGFI